MRRDAAVMLGLHSNKFKGKEKSNKYHRESSGQVFLNGFPSWLPVSATADSDCAGAFSRTG